MKALYKHLKQSSKLRNSKHSFSKKKYLKKKVNLNSLNPSFKLLNKILTKKRKCTILNVFIKVFKHSLRNFFLQIKFFLV